MFHCVDCGRDCKLEMFPDVPMFPKMFHCVDCGRDCKDALDFFIHLTVKHDVDWRKARALIEAQEDKKNRQ